MSARDDILERIRRALGPVRPDLPPIARGYRQMANRPEEARLALLEERLLGYRARVRRCRADALPEVVAAAIAGHGARRLVVPAGLDVALPPDRDVVIDEGQLSAAELDAFDGVVTAATVAIAETGTIVLDGSTGQGRRAITLVPDYHLCVVHASQVVDTVPEAIALLRPERPSTWVSGPSATSDIELDRVEGVHGPRTLEVILVDADPGLGGVG